MRLSGSLRTMTLAAIVLLRAAAPAAAEVLKEEPPKNSLPRGKVVYVDDGSCPAGEIKEITGGSQDKGVRRQVRCIKRPS